MTENNRFKELRYRAPEALRAELTALAAGPPSAAPLSSVRDFRQWLKPALACAAVLAFMMWTNLESRRGSTLVLEQELAGSHVRSLIADHLFDIASSDRHTVKPWFAGKLDFSPPVIDLKSSGFPLVGGRLDYLDKRAVAAIIYKSDEHVINLFVWPGGGRTAERPDFSSTHGFNLVSWSHGGMELHAISDLNPDDLKDFAAQWMRTVDAK